MLDYILSKTAIIIFAVLLFATFFALEKNLELYFFYRSAQNICHKLITETKYVVESISIEQMRTIALPRTLKVGLSSYSYSVDANYVSYDGNKYIVYIIKFKKRPVYACAYQLYGDYKNINVNIRGFPVIPYKDKRYIGITKNNNDLNIEGRKVPIS